MSTCPRLTCGGHALRPLKRSVCQLLSLEAIFDVYVQSSACPRCGLVVGPWDTESNAGCLVFEGQRVVLTLPWLAKAGAAVSDWAPPGKECTTLIAHALRQMGGGLPSEDVQEAYPPARIADLSARARRSLPAAFTLWPELLYGKLYCSRCSLASPVRVMDGNMKQTTRLQSSHIDWGPYLEDDGGRPEQADPDDGAPSDDEGEIARQIGEEVSDAVHRSSASRAARKKTAPFGKALDGGYLAHEVHHLFGRLECVLIGTYGNLESYRHTRYRLHWAPVFIPAASRAPHMFLGNHLKKGRAGTDGTCKSSYADDTLLAAFALFGAKDEDFQAGMACLHKHTAERLAEWLEAFRQEALLMGVCPKVPLKGLQRSDTITFFQDMQARLYRGSDIHQRKVNTFKDSGPFDACCACGNAITLGRKQLARKEIPVDASDVIFGGTNNKPDGLVYDNACTQGLSVGLPQYSSSDLGRCPWDGCVCRDIWRCGCRACLAQWAVGRASGLRWTPRLRLWTPGTVQAKPRRRSPCPA